MTFLHKFFVLRNLIAQRPILVIFDVTKLCNERCPMCNIWKARSDDMPLGQIEALAERLSRFGVGYVFLQGGEPLLRQDIMGIADAFIGVGIKPTVITNGILLTPDKAREIAKRPCNLAISVDSLDPGLFKKLRGVDALDQVLANAEAISGLKHRGNWSITTTVSAMSEEDDVFAIERFALERGFMHAIRPYIHVSGTAGRKVDAMCGERDKLLRIFRRYAAAARRRNYLAWPVYRRHIAYIEGQAMPMCDAMRRSFLLKENGAMASCIEFPGLEVDLGDFQACQERHNPTLRQCNRKHPCFYNDAREIGILWDAKWKVALHAPAILLQMARYGNFF